MGRIIYCYECEGEFPQEEYVDGCCPTCGAKHPQYDYPSDETCGKCFCYLDPEDNYCRHCGTKAGVKFEPRWNIMDTLYGPPPIPTEHTCKYCGNQWTSYDFDWTDEEIRYFCPNCGKEEYNLEEGSMKNYKTLEELIKDYLDKSEREQQLQQMSNEEIDILIEHMRNIQGKIYLKSFKK